MKTTCPYCGVGCGLVVENDSAGRVGVRGDPHHPANAGRICSKGAALAETLSLEGRLLKAEIAGRPVTLDTALDAVAEGFSRSIREHGPDSVAFYLSGQLLTEDYYVANKLMKGFIGSGNVDTNSRLCMASSVAGHRRAFGSDTVPGNYEDLELADLVVLVGSNLAWCHPVLYQRIEAAREMRPAMKVVVIDPRRTATCQDATLHLPIRPGTDAVLFNGLLVHLEASGCIDQAFVARSTSGWDAALRAARSSAPDTASVAAQCGLAVADVEAFFAMVATTTNTVTVYSQGINQSASGTDKVNAIINCHFATGRIGRPGMGPFSVTGQPNAMGGREVGGLANQLAAHLDFERPEHIALLRRFWSAPNLAEQPGLKAVDMFRAVEDGRVKAIWIMATNPLVSMPDAARVRRALAACDFVVVSDCIRSTDTGRTADVLLPALAWGEKSGTVTNSERRISRQRAFLPAHGGARADWELVCGVARRMGFGAAFDYHSAAEIFREHAALSAFENAGSRDFDIGKLSQLSEAEYDALEPVHWPFRIGDALPAERMFADGRFYTGDGRARFVAVSPRTTVYAADQSFPLLLNTGRVRDQWHTMTRTGRSPRLSQHEAEPRLLVHPDDAACHGLQDDHVAEIHSRWGKALARVKVTGDQTPGCVFLPMHWAGQFAAHSRINELVNPVVDPLSGQPELKSTPVSVRPFAARWHGFLLTRSPLPWPHAAYWVGVRLTRGWRYELAGDDDPASAIARLQHDLRRVSPDIGWSEHRRPDDLNYRGALIANHELLAVLVIGATPPGRAVRDTLAKLFIKGRLTALEQEAMLAPANIAAGCDSGQTICACYGLRDHTIVDVARSRGLRSIEAVGEIIKAGTLCGSCRPEMRRLLAEMAP